MISADEQTWNIRDEHMADCVASLMAFQCRKSGKPVFAVLLVNAVLMHLKCKIVIWAHNSHIGDARATASRRLRGEWNIGQLLWVPLAPSILTSRTDDSGWARTRCTTSALARTPAR
jgi:erythromycin esterase-like protein